MKNISGPVGFTGEFYQRCKKNYNLLLKKKIFHQIEKKETLFNSFYEAGITVISKALKEQKTRDQYLS